jgi:NAD(P)-dependent dehydrogenase (short-subunit alcohol dehydrogenase family)
LNAWQDWGAILPTGDFHKQLSLTGKTAIVTGAVGILGRRFCAGLAEFGANVVVVDLNQSACDELARSLREKYGVEALGIACDVSSEESVLRMVRASVERFGEIHVLHNNAAGKSDDLEQFFAPFEEYSLSQWRRIMAVNIDGMFLVAREVGKRMAAQGKGGSIIQTSSIYGAMAPDQRIYEGSRYLDRQINTPAVYSASKAGVIGLTRYLATYWADQGIRVNALSPGGVESGQNETFIRNYSARVPLGRMAYADEMVGALIFLASDASSYVTGQNFLVDGGLGVW